MSSIFRFEDLIPGERVALCTHDIVDRLVPLYIKYLSHYTAHGLSFGFPNPSFHRALPRPVTVKRFLPDPPHYPSIIKVGWLLRRSPTSRWSLCYTILSRPPSPSEPFRAAFFHSPPSADSPYRAPVPRYCVSLRGVDIRPWTAADRAECGGTAEHVGITIAPRYGRRRLTYLLFIGEEAYEAAEAWACALRVGSLLSSAATTLHPREGGVRERKGAAPKGRGSGAAGAAQSKSAAGARAGGEGAEAVSVVALLSGVEGAEGGGGEGEGWGGSSGSGSASSNQTESAYGGGVGGSAASLLRPPAALEVAAFEAAWFWMRILRPSASGCPWVPTTGLAVRIPLGGMARVTEHLLDVKEKEKRAAMLFGGGDADSMCSEETMETEESDDDAGQKSKSGAKGGKGSVSFSFAVAADDDDGKKGGSKGRAGGGLKSDMRESDAIIAATPRIWSDDPEADVVATYTRSYGHGRQGRSLSQLTRRDGVLGRRLLNAATSRHWGVSQAAIRELAVSCVLRAANDKRRKRLKIDPRFGFRGMERGVVAAGPPVGGEGSLSDHVVAMVCDVISETLLGVNAAVVPANISDSDEDQRLGDKLRVALDGVENSVSFVFKSMTMSTAALGQVMSQGGPPGGAEDNNAGMASGRYGRTTSIHSNSSFANPTTRARRASMATRSRSGTVNEQSSFRSFGAPASAMAVVGVHGRATSAGPAHGRTMYRINDVRRATVRVNRFGRAGVLGAGKGACPMTLDGRFDLESPWAGGPGAPPDGFVQDAMRIYVPLGATEHYARRHVDMAVAETAAAAAVPRLEAMIAGAESVFACAQDRVATAASTPASQADQAAARASGVKGSGPDRCVSIYDAHLLRPSAELRAAVTRAIAPLVANVVAPISSLVRALVAPALEVFRVVMDVTVPSAAASGYGPTPSCGGDARRNVRGMTGFEFFNRPAVEVRKKASVGASGSVKGGGWASTVSERKRALWGRWQIACEASSVDEPRGLDDYSLCGWMALPDALLPIDTALVAFADVAWALEDQFVLARRVHHVHSARADGAAAPAAGSKPPGAAGGSSGSPSTGGGVAGPKRPPWLRLAAEAGAPDPIRVDVLVDALGQEALRVVMSTVEAATRLHEGGLEADDAWRKAVMAAAAEGVEITKDICASAVEEAVVRQLVLFSYWTSPGHPSSFATTRSLALGEAVAKYMAALHPSLVSFCDPRFEIAHAVQEAVSAKAAEVLHPYIAGAAVVLGTLATEPLSFKKRASASAPSSVTAPAPAPSSARDWVDDDGQSTRFASMRSIVSPSQKAVQSTPLESPDSLRRQRAVLDDDEDEKASEASPSKVWRGTQVVDDDDSDDDETSPAAAPSSAAPSLQRSTAAKETSPPPTRLPTRRSGDCALVTLSQPRGASYGGGPRRQAGGRAASPAAERRGGVVAGRRKAAKQAGAGRKAGSSVPVAARPAGPADAFGARRPLGFSPKGRLPES